jgi:hypothetical protein
MSLMVAALIALQGTKPSGWISTAAATGLPRTSIKCEITIPKRVVRAGEHLAVYVRLKNISKTGLRVLPWDYDEFVCRPLKKRWHGEIEVDSFGDDIEPTVADLVKLPPGSSRRHLVSIASVSMPGRYRISVIAHLRAPEGLTSDDIISGAFQSQPVAIQVKARTKRLRLERRRNPVKHPVATRGSDVSRQRAKLHSVR